MAISFTLGAYWKLRPDSPQKCAEYLADFLQSLSGVHSVFANWYLKAGSRSEALKKKIQNYSDLFQGTSTITNSQGLSQHAGYTFGLWNGLDNSAAASATIMCGSTAASLASSGNSILLTLPEVFIQSASIVSLVDLVKIAIDSWHAEIATIYSNVAFDEQPSRPFIDWILYLPKSQSIIALPEGVDRRSHNEIGDIYIMSQVIPAYNDLAFRQRVSAMCACLKHLKVW